MDSSAEGAENAVMMSITVVSQQSIVLDSPGDVGLGSTCDASCAEPGGRSGRTHVHTSGTEMDDDLCAF